MTDFPMLARLSVVLPTVALSIRQPYPWHILYDGKDVENRDWPTHFRGPVLIHASKGVDSEDRAEVREKSMPLGGIVGVMEIVDCVTDWPSDWFYGRYGFVIRNARPLPFMPCKGALSFFKVDIRSLVAQSWHRDEISEGQGSKMLNIDRIGFRKLCDEVGTP